MPDFKTQPEGVIVLSKAVSLDDITNGEIRVLSKACGCRFQDIREYYEWNTEDVYQTDADGDQVLVATGRGRYDGPVDEADLVWALGKISLRREGYAGTDDEADRAQFEFDPEVSVDPTPAA